MGRYRASRVILGLQGAEFGLLWPGVAGLWIPDCVRFFPKSCPTFATLIDCSRPGSLSRFSRTGIFHILEWAGPSFSGDFPDPRIEPVALPYFQHYRQIL